MGVLRRSGQAREPGLRRLRRKAGFTLAEAAQELGTSQSHLQSIESGRVQPGKELQDRMATSYRKPLSEIRNAVVADCLAFMERAKARLEGTA